MLGGSSIPIFHQIITFTAVVNSHEYTNSLLEKCNLNLNLFPKLLYLIMKNFNKAKKEIRKEI